MAIDLIRNITANNNEPAKRQPSIVFVVSFLSFNIVTFSKNLV